MGLPLPGSRGRPPRAADRRGAGGRIRLNGEIDGVLAVRIDDALVTGLYVVRNPEKLSRVERETVVSRASP